MSDLWVTDRQTDRQTLTTTISSRPLDMGIQQSCSTWFRFSRTFFFQFYFSFFPLLSLSIVKPLFLFFFVYLNLGCQNEVAAFIVVVIVVVLIVVVVVVIVVMVGAHRPGECIQGREEDREKEKLMTQFSTPSPSPPSESPVHNVKLSRRSCIIRVLSL